MIQKTVLDTFKDKDVLVTGGTGLIGRQVVDILLSTGAIVHTVSLDYVTLDERVLHIKADLTDFNVCKLLTAGKDYVFHLAGIKGSVVVTKSRPASFFVPLLQMNTNVLEACRLNNVAKVVYTSSIGAYPTRELFVEEVEPSLEAPMDTYPGWAKRMAEMQIEAYRIEHNLDNYAIVRPCNVYGPGDNFDPDNAMVIPALMARIHNGEDPLVVWGDGTAIRDFSFSKDVAEGIILALHYGTESRYYNVGSGIACTIRELVEALNSFIPFKYEFDVSKATGFSKRVMDITLAKEKLGYCPSTSLVDGLKQTWEWFIEHDQEYKKKQNYFK